MLSDIGRVKLLKTKKIDVRLDQELFDLVDNYAQASRLSRAQVVERALLNLFGRPVSDHPQTPEKNGPQIAKIYRPSKTSDGGSSPAKTRNFRQTG